jgi:hypothetical protein
MIQGTVMETPLHRARRAQRAAAGHCIGAWLVIAACGDGAGSPPPSPSSPFVTTPEQMPAGGAAAGGTESATSEGDSPGTTPSEGVDEELGRVGGEATATGGPAPAAEGPAAPVLEEAPDVIDPGQAVPAIGLPGFPAGSAPRLVPMQFVGPVTGQPVLFNVYLPPGYDSGAA